MRIEYSLKDTPTDHVVIENASCFIQWDKECIILRNGEHIVLLDNEIEDFSWREDS
jgi:hypothetical protein